MHVDSSTSVSTPPTQPPQLASTFFIVIFGEIVPQATFTRYSLAIGSALVIPVKVLPSDPLRNSRCIEFGCCTIFLTMLNHEQFNSFGPSNSP